MCEEVTGVLLLPPACSGLPCYARAEVLNLFASMYPLGLISHAFLAFTDISY